MVFKTEGFIEETYQIKHLPRHQPSVTDSGDVWIFKRNCPLNVFN